MVNLFCKLKFMSIPHIKSNKRPSPQLQKSLYVIELTHLNQH